MRSAFLIFLPLLSLLSLSPSTSAGGDCAATITPDLKLHIPLLAYGSDLYSADLSYVPSSDGYIWFGLTGINAPDTISCSDASALGIISNSAQIYIPDLTVGQDSFWATLEYVPNSTVAPLAMKVNSAGLAAGPDPLAPLVPEGPRNLRFYSAFYGKITGPDISVNFKDFGFNIAVTSDMPLGAPEIHSDMDMLYYSNVVNEITTTKFDCWVDYSPTTIQVWTDCTCKGSIPQDTQRLLSLDSLSIVHPNSSSPEIQLLYFVDPFDIRIDAQCKMYGAPEPRPLMTVFGGVFNFPYMYTHEADLLSGTAYQIGKDQWSFYRDPQWRLATYAHKQYFDATGTEVVGIHTIDLVEVATSISLDK